MYKCIVFIVGAVAALVSEAFWKGESEGCWSLALWGGTGMLLLRRVVLRFPSQSRVLLSLFGALLLLALWLTLLLIREGWALHVGRRGSCQLAVGVPSFSYCLYRFMLIAPSYTIIEYLEACFRI